MRFSFCTRPGSLAAAILVISSSVASQPARLAAQSSSTGDTSRAGRFDAGKMWTFEYAPIEYFSTTYGFNADTAWFRRARLAALRIPGCSASFVSPNGLLATNHHCVRDNVSKVSKPGETLLDSGFYAVQQEQERRIPGMYADQLVAVEDVTSEVDRALAAATGEPAREQARRDVLAAIMARLIRATPPAGDSLWVQIVPLYQGGRHSAYVFARFTDIRLVAAAEVQMGFFGGDPDNFTFPRYALDFAFLRVYGRDGRPYRSPTHFTWSSTGVSEGDAVFVIGNPGPTNRMTAVAQLEFQRDVEVAAAVSYQSTRHAALDEYRRANPAEAEGIDIRNRMFSVSNSLKSQTGRLKALNDPAIMARRRDAERDLRNAVRARPELQRQYGDVFDRIARVQEQKRALTPAWRAFAGMGNPANEAVVLRRAIAALSYLLAGPDSAPPFRRRLLEMADQPRDLDRRLLAARLNDFVRHLGPGHPITRALQSRPPADAAGTLLRTSALADSARTAQAVSAGTLTRDDPAIQIVTALLPPLVEFQRESARLAAEEREQTGRLGRLRFEVYGKDVPPDATFSPRITDGVVRRYQYNGTEAAPYTTFYGLYDRFAAFGPGTDWDLPLRWRTPPSGLNLATPLNFVSTADTYGGNSGSPAVTRDLALVGLNFDRNVEALSRDFIYLPERGRNIMVDVRAIRAALEHVYGAERLVRELTGR